jgi:sugar phosphate isomerase/epimerase
LTFCVLNGKACAALNTGGAGHLTSDAGMSGRIVPAFALDHLTVVDSTPSQLVDAAAAAGCRAVCLFTEPMAVLPSMPQFELYGITQEARETKARMQDLGVGVDLAYPYSLGARTDIENFHPALEIAAWLGVVGVNALVYDRDPSRRFDKFAAFSELAATYGLKVALEFYPSSQIPSLAAALELVMQVGKPEQAGINVDLLHLVRSGGTLAALRACPPHYIHYAQYCDGPIPGPVAGMTPEDEASFFRLLAGEGMFDLTGFAVALPQGVPASVELPRDGARRAGERLEKRACLAVDSVRRVLIKDQNEMELPCFRRSR